MHVAVWTSVHSSAPRDHLISSKPVRSLPSVVVILVGFALKCVTRKLLGHPGILLMQVLLNEGSRRVFLVTGMGKTCRSLMLAAQ